MNSADQGVFPMDTAFKRRWRFNYIGIDDEEFKVDNSTTPATVTELQNDSFNLADGSIEWNVLRRALNQKLSNDRIKVHEDKLMGPFFIKVLDENGTSIFSPTTKDEEFIELFCDKVLMYLFEDAAKTKRTELFEGCDKSKLNRYSYICHEFKNKDLVSLGETLGRKSMQIRLSSVIKLKLIKQYKGRIMRIISAYVREDWYYSVNPQNAVFVYKGKLSNRRSSKRDLQLFIKDLLAGTS